MSKIEIYNKKLQIANEVKRCLNMSRGIGEDGHIDRTIDKKNCELKVSNTKIYANIYHGFYGSSSAYEHNDPDIIKFLVMAINRNMNIIIDDAIETARLEAMAARQEAIDEAHAVLRETA